MVIEDQPWAADFSNLGAGDDGEVVEVAPASRLSGATSRPVGVGSGATSASTLSPHHKRRVDRGFRSQAREQWKVHECKS